MPLLSEMLRRNLDRLDGLTDRDCRTSCPTCGTEQTLEEASVDLSDPLETTYACHRGCGLILLVTTLFVRPPGSKAGIKFPSSPHALD